MTKRTPTPPEVGPDAPAESDQDALLRRLMDDVLAQPPSESEADLVDRLAEAVTGRLAGAEKADGQAQTTASDLSDGTPGPHAVGERPDPH